MPTTVQFRRGNQTQNDSFTGAAGEITFDTTNKTIRVHDGSTQGGFIVASDQTIPSTIASNSFLTSTYTTNTQFQSALANTNSYIATKFNTSGGSITGNVTITGNIVPSADDTYSLGSATNSWADVYVGPGSLYVNGKQVLTDDSETITVQTDEDQNLVVKTFGTGVTTVQSNTNVYIQGNGSGDVTLITGAGNIELKGNVEVLAGKQINSSDGNAIQFGDAFDMNNNKITELGAPTADTDAATKKYVDDEVAGLVDSAPSTLNTLNELAAALGDDPNFATTLTTNLGQKLGAAATVQLTGDLTAGPTAFSSNSVSLSTTLASTGTPTGTFGSGSKIPIITVDAKGRITNISNTDVAGVTGVTFTAANNNLRVSTADGATYDTTIDVSDKATWTALTSTNTAIRALVSDRLQVANAASTYQTIAIERAALANTNAYIATKLNSSSYTASDVLTKIKTVDGASSGLDADLLDGQEGTYYLDWTNVTNKPDPTITLGGDLSGSLTLTDLAGGTLTATVADDSHNHSSSSGAFTVGTDLTVSGGDIILSGTGRIQGVDTVSAGTDAANKTYVDTAIANLVDSAPAALDTLNELAAALGDNANFATTIATNLGQKLGATASVTLTGDVSGTASFSANAVSITTTVADDSHNHVISNVDGLQTALDAKQATITGAATTIDTENLTASRALVSDGSGKVAVSAVTSTELGYLDGVTSAIQTQLNAKQASDADLTAIAALSSADGNFIVGSASGWVAESGATARTSLGLGSLATLSTINNSNWSGTDLSLANGGTGASLSDPNDDRILFWDDSAGAMTWLDIGTGLSLSGTTLSYTNTAGYITGNQTITLSGDVTGSGTTSISVTIADDSHNHIISNVDGLQTALDAKLALSGGTVTGDLTVNGTLNVLTAIDLADNDILRFGTGDDAEFFTDGTHFYLDLNAGIGNFIIRDGTTTRFTFDDAGHFTATGDITASSDERLKENVTDLSDSLEKVKQLRGISFNRLGEEKTQIGVIAQEIEKVLPEVVREDGDGYKSVAYGNIVALLIEAIKEQQEQIEELKSKVELL